MLILKKVLYLLLLSFTTFGFSQEISGVVFNDKSGEPLVGASVYFNNTTLGTSTNLNGAFKLEYKEAIKTSLIISFMGFETLIINEFSRLDNLKFNLKESPNVLNEVVLYNGDDWSRELKLQEFRKSYLGESENGLASKILNEDDIILRYNSKTKQLLAKTTTPIVIENTKLQYLITAELEKFEVYYSFVSKNKKRLKVGYVYYSGRNFYKSMQTPTKSINDKRLDAYFGSTLHFMRAVARKNIEKEGYILYIGNIPSKPKELIKISHVSGKDGVTVQLKENFNILYNYKERSSIDVQISKFYIDSFGSHFPPFAVKFGGDFGKQRMGDALPLDFLMVQNKN